MSAVVWFLDDDGEAFAVEAIEVIGPFALLPTRLTGDVAPDGMPLCELVQSVASDLEHLPDAWMLVHRPRGRIMGHCPTREHARAFCEAALVTHGDLWEMDEQAGPAERDRLRTWWTSVEGAYFICEEV